MIFAGMAPNGRALGAVGRGEVAVAASAKHSLAAVDPLPASYHQSEWLLVWPQSVSVAASDLICESVQGASMSYTLAQKMNRSLRWLLAIGAFAAIVVQGVYLYKFGAVLGAWFTLSSDPAVWGQYGDYVGGLLNPIFSSLAFSGLVVTIVLQARQIDDAKRNAELEEMQRVQSTIAARIDHLLTSAVIVNTREYENLRRFTDNPQTVFELISSLGTMALSEPGEGDTNWLKWLWDDVTAEGLRKALDAQTVPLRLEFESLSFMLMSYEEHQGSQVVIDFYRYRFTTVLVWLDALGLLDAHQQVQRCFNPKERRPLVRPDSHSR